jgi:hypothetical protein
VNFDTSLYAKYDDADFAASPLWIALTNSEVFIEHLRTRSNCAECGKGRAAVDTSARVPHVPRKSGFVSVNGEFHIARSDLKRAMEQELTGTRFLPFDDAGQYFYVLAEKELGPLVIEPRQPGFIGFCSVCGRPQFRPSWEPDGYIPTIQCYRANTWSGQDLAWSDRYEMAFFSPRAFRLLKKFQKGIKRSIPIYVEQPWLDLSQ